jgi:hypothetical protein
MDPTPFPAFEPSDLPRYRWLSYLLATKIRESNRSRLAAAPSSEASQRLGDQAAIWCPRAWVLPRAARAAAPPMRPKAFMRLPRSRTTCCAHGERDVDSVVAHRRRDHKEKASSLLVRLNILIKPPELTERYSSASISSRDFRAVSRHHRQVLDPISSSFPLCPAQPIRILYRWWQM